MVHYKISNTQDTNDGGVEEWKKTYVIENNTKMAYIMISNYIKWNGLTAPIKRQRLAKWIKNTIQLYAVCKTYTLDPEAQID